MRTGAIVVVDMTMWSNTSPIVCLPEQPPPEHLGTVDARLYGRAAHVTPASSPAGPLTFLHANESQDHNCIFPRSAS